MGKHHKRAGKLAQDLAGPGSREWQTRVESLLAARKTREAVEVAKQFLKQSPGPEAEALAVAAYQARIQALLASGMHKEAQALGALVSERFPAYRRRSLRSYTRARFRPGTFRRC